LCPPNIAAKKAVGARRIGALDFPGNYYAHLPAQLQEEIEKEQLSGYNFFITGQICASSSANGAAWGIYKTPGGPESSLYGLMR